MVDMVVPRAHLAETTGSLLRMLQGLPSVEAAD